MNMVKQGIVTFILINSVAFVSSIYSMNADQVLWEAVEKDKLRMVRVHEALFAAVGRGDKKAAEDALKEGADVNVVGLYDRTPLTVAARDGHLQIAELLIDNKADIHAAGQCGYTPFLWAVEKGQTSIAQLLVQNKAQPEVRMLSGYTPLIHAVSHGYVQMTEWLLEINADVNAVDNSGYTPLMWALLHYNNKLTRLLLSKNPAIDVADKCGRTALRHAINHRRDFSIVEMLILAGADCDSVALDGSSVREAPAAISPDMRQMIIAAQQKRVELQATLNEELFAAAKKDANAVREALAKGAHINALDRGGETPLMRAIEYGRTDVVDMLLAHKADVNVVAKTVENVPDYLDWTGYTALILAAAHGCIDIVQTLLNNKADVNSVAKNGACALVFCFWNNEDAETAHESLEIAKVLIAAGADCMSMVSRHPDIMEKAPSAMRQLIMVAQQKEDAREHIIGGISDQERDRALEIVVCNQLAYVQTGEDRLSEVGEVVVDTGAGET